MEMATRQLIRVSNGVRELILLSTWWFVSKVKDRDDKMIFRDQILPPYPLTR